MTHCCSNLAVHTDLFTLNPSYIFWMIHDTKYIQNSNLKLSFKNWEALLEFFNWLNPFQSAIAHITEKEKQTLISYQAKCILQWKRFLWISNEQYLVRRMKYVASPFLHQFYDVYFTETALESLSKTLVIVSLMQIDLLVSAARGVMVQSASYFLYLFVTCRRQIKTSFSCLR